MTQAISGTWTLAGGDNITLSQSGNNVSIIGQPAGTIVQIDGIDANLGSINTAAFPQLAEDFYNNVVANNTAIALGQTMSYMQPFQVPYPINVAYLRFPVSMTHGAQTSIGTSANTSVSASMLTTWNFQIFTDGAGANSQSLQEFASTSAGMTYRISIQEAGAASSASWSQQITYPMSSTAQANFATNSNVSTNSIQVSTSLMSNWVNGKVFDVPWTTFLPAGNYWFAFGSSTTQAQQVAAMSVFTSQGQPMSFFNQTGQNMNAVGELGGATNSSIMYPMGMGSFSNAGGGKSASISYGNISMSSSLPQFIIGMVRIS